MKKIIRIIIGIIVCALGISALLLGCVVIGSGQWILAVVLYLGMSVIFVGLGFAWLGMKLIFNTTACELLFRIAESKTTPVGLKVHIYRLARLTGVLSKIIFYILIAIAILLISIMSVSRYTHLPINLDVFTNR